MAFFGVSGYRQGRLRPLQAVQRIRFPAFSGENGG